jgi:hypothetical protein
MRKSTGDHGRGAVYDIAVVTGKGLMIAAIGLATLDVCLLLVDAFTS